MTAGTTCVVLGLAAALATGGPGETVLTGQSADAGCSGCRIVDPTKVADRSRRW